MKNARFETLAVHGGQSPDPSVNSRAVPIHRTTSFTFNSAKHAADLFDLKSQGYIYTRLGNPTQEILETRLAMLEGAAGTLALSSGTSAVFYAVINLARQGDEIVAAANLYGGTYTMFDAILPQFGITTRFVPSGRAEDFAKAITPRTRAIFTETIGNPGLDAADIAALAEVARAHHIPLVVDSTFTTPYLCRPMEHGADIVIHSLTKWIGGHGTAIGGLVADSGRFDWSDSKFALYEEPDSSYHGLRWGHDLEDLPPYITRMRTVPLRNLGACITPDNAWMFLQGLETLPLRMDRHCENAKAVAEYLAAHPKASWVRYPGMKGDPSYELGQKYFPKGAGGMVVFGVASEGAEAGKLAGGKFIERLRLFSHLANVGDAKSLALHPASTTHSQMSGEQQEASGLKPELIRLSVGLEHKDDILEDLEQALNGI